MILGIFLAIGESWEDFKRKGQDELLLKNNFHVYSQNFTYVYVFSYGKMGGKLLPNVYLVPNTWRLHRYLYCFILPMIHRSLIRNLDVIRGMQLTGGLPALVAKLFFRKRIVLNYGFDYAQLTRTEGKILRSWTYRILEKILLPHIDALIVMTSELKQRISRYRKLAVYLIPNGVDVGKYKPMRKKKIATILYVGRLERQKNLPLLLNAVNHIPHFSGNILFIGNGSKKKLLIKQAKALDVSLRIIDSVPHNHLPQYYNTAQIFILPSLIEGHPKALLEAMSCGMPVIGTDVEGINTLITSGHDGLLAKPDSHELSEAIYKLLHDSHLRSILGRNARSTIVNNYSSKLVWQREIRLLKNMKN